MAFRVLVMAAAMGLGLAPWGAARAELPRALYTVEAVPVDVTGANPVSAREVGIASAQANAYQRLIRRFVPEPEAGRVPQASGTDLERLAAAVEVIEEKAAGNRYIAKITVVFRPDEVRRRLRASGQPFSLTQARPALILPLAEGPDNGGAFRRALDLLPKAAWLEPVALPIAEMGDLDPAKLAAGDGATLAAAAQRNGALVVAVAKAVLDPPDPKAPPPTSAAPGGPGPAPPALTLSVQVFGATTGGEPRPDTMTAQGPVQVWRLAPEANDTLETLMARAATQMVDRINEPWKRASAQDQSVQISVEAHALFMTFPEWLAIREALAGAPAVTRLEVLELSTTGAALRLAVTGAPERLAVALAQRDVRLQVEASPWRITRGPARPAP